jgi:hypothetical protein
MLRAADVWRSGVFAILLFLCVADLSAVGRLDVASRTVTTDARVLNPASDQARAISDSPLPSGPSEQRTLLRLRFAKTVDGTGSFTVVALKDQVAMNLVDRPGDSVLHDLQGRLTDGATLTLFKDVPVWMGEGSEIRFSDYFECEGAKVACRRSDVRLCFKKTSDGWVYLCGSGLIQYKNDQSAVMLGEDRTVDSCLALLSSGDAILREGAVRDLGRVSSRENYVRVIPRLATLLHDADPRIRRGAAEALGFIGVEDSVGPLKTLAAGETDNTTQRFIAEALALCAGNALIAGPGTGRIPGPEAASLYDSGRSFWTRDVMIGRIHMVGAAAARALIARLGATDRTERLVAADLLGAAKCVEARDELTKLAASDADYGVRAACKQALDALPAMANP